MAVGALLKIESDELVGLANRLAELTGSSVEAALSQSLRESVARQEAIQAKLAKIREITADMRSKMPHPLPSSDHSWLYDDETGLPK